MYMYILIWVDRDVDIYQIHLDHTDRIDINATYLTKSQIKLVPLQRIYNTMVVQSMNIQS